MTPLTCNNVFHGDENKLHRLIDAFIHQPEKLPKFEEVQGFVVPLANHDVGCRLLQLALAGYCTAERRELAKEFRGHVRVAVESQHANHVLQRLVELLPPASLCFVVEELEKTWCSAAMAKHRFGCRLLERFLEHFTACPLAGAELGRFLGGLLRDVQELCFHPFGNFVMQHVLEYGSEEQRRMTLACLRKDLRKVALDEHAVCVLDKALAVMPTQDQQMLVAEIIQQLDLLPLLANLRSGQFLAERLLLSASPSLLMKLNCNLEIHHEALNASKGGRRFLEALQRRRCPQN
jgi:hypothetical protein